MIAFQSPENPTILDQQIDYKKIQHEILVI